MELSVSDRMSLLAILPAQGDITTLRILRELRESLSFSEEEHKQFGIVVDGANIHWDGNCNSSTDIPIGPKAQEVVVASLHDGDKKQILTDAHIGVWDKFIDEDKANLKLTESAG